MSVFTIRGLINEKFNDMGGGHPQTSSGDDLSLITSGVPTSTCICWVPGVALDDLFPIISGSAYHVTGACQSHNIRIACT